MKQYTLIGTLVAICIYFLIAVASYNTPKCNASVKTLTARVNGEMLPDGIVDIRMAQGDSVQIKWTISGAESAQLKINSRAETIGFEGQKTIVARDTTTIIITAQGDGKECKQVRQLNVLAYEEGSTLLLPLLRTDPGKFQSIDNLGYIQPKLWASRFWMSSCATSWSVRQTDLNGVPGPSFNIPGLTPVNVDFPIAGKYSAENPPGSDCAPAYAFFQVRFR